jgi:hypothetical protein
LHGYLHRDSAAVKARARELRAQFLRPIVAHRADLRGVGVELGAFDCHSAKPQQAGFASNEQHLQEGRLEGGAARAAEGMLYRRSEPVTLRLHLLRRAGRAALCNTKGRSLRGGTKPLLATAEHTSASRWLDLAHMSDGKGGHRPVVGANSPADERFPWPYPLVKLSLLFS